ncbi:MAG: hypothetical protein WCA46_06450 [Actinocatenispora sp.]
MSDQDNREKPGLRTHPTDVVSLVFGLIFLGLAGWWLLDLVAGVTLPLGWLLAVTLIVVGGIGLFAAVRPGRRRHGDEPPHRS